MTIEQKSGFLRILLGTLAASLLGSALTGRRNNKSWPKFLMLPHPLNNFETQKFYQIKPKFNADYSRNNLSKIKGGTYIINPDECESIETH